jgi:hypothetical protein
MGSRAGLAAIEAILGASGIAPAVEALLPAGVRHRQLPAQTLLTAMMLAPGDRRPAHLRQARAALTCLPEAGQVRPGITEDGHGRPHQLTCRQVEHTCRLITTTLSKDSPDGPPPLTCRRSATSCRHHQRLRLRPPRPRRLGRPAPALRRPAGARPAPHDRCPRGTHQGATTANGNLYRPCPPRTPPEPAPLPPAASRPPTTTSRPPNPPGTNPASSPPTTPTATTRSSARPRPARPAARPAPPR